ncbi:hypothetical protein [Rhizobium sp. RU35A]|uniref:hypothetical protein n=1 Tax=Rhizobium sp. RU35A TaxID=1907414 RepID=UPI00165F90FE|nr:hypothetical protein [Rhizobium sp. RU35A]
MVARTIQFPLSSADECIPDILGIAVSVVELFETFRALEDWSFRPGLSIYLSRFDLMAQDAFLSTPPSARKFSIDEENGPPSRQGLLLAAVLTIGALMQLTEGGRKALCPLSPTSTKPVSPCFGLWPAAPAAFS